MLVGAGWGWTGRWTDCSAGTPTAVPAVRRYGRVLLRGAFWEESTRDRLIPPNTSVILILILHSWILCNLMFGNAFHSEIKGA